MCLSLLLLLHSTQAFFMNLHFPIKQMGENHHLKYYDMEEDLVEINTGTNAFLITMCALIKYCNRSYLLFCLKDIIYYMHWWKKEVSYRGHNKHLSLLALWLIYTDKIIFSLCDFTKVGMLYKYYMNISHSTPGICTEDDLQEVTSCYLFC